MNPTSNVGVARGVVTERAHDIVARCSSPGTPCAIQPEQAGRCVLLWYAVCREFSPGHHVHSSQSRLAGVSCCGTLCVVSSARDTMCTPARAGRQVC
jgi:hypothetical protein